MWALKYASLLVIPYISKGEDPLPYGSVEFDTSCDPSVSDDFDTAVSMLYSFWYSKSLSTFIDISARDPTCCMTYWGAAMTYNHPIWDYIEDDRLQAAENYVKQAVECATSNMSSVTERELGYISSLAMYLNTSDPVLNDNATARLQKFVDATNELVFTPYGKTDENAGVIYGLALLGLGYYSESEPAQGFPNLGAAGYHENQVLVENPDNPGALHYVIHAFDQPSSATQALEAAYHYQDVSVAVPHAVHMPSHIFSDVGLWNDMIEANIDSMNLAYENANATTGDWYHASYFLQFGMLQLAMDCDAASLMATFQDLSKTDQDMFNAEGAVRVPTMYLIETRQWEQAAHFELENFYSLPQSFWDDSPWTLVTTYFMMTAAKAVLDYPVDEITAARQALDRANKALLSDPDWNLHQLPYWRLSFDMMADAAAAWETFRMKSMDAGISAMQEVIKIQESSWYPEVAHTWDANEQLAEMYLLRRQQGDVRRALEAYEHAMKSYPNRYRTIAGAGECAEELEDDEKAALYYGQLLLLTEGPLPDVETIGVYRPECPAYTNDRRPEMVDAQNYLVNNKTN